jgi:SAM-dependent methyltransferase
MLVSTLPLASRVEPCDLCGHAQFRIVGDRDRRRRPLLTVICETCGLVSHERIPTDDELDSYYAQLYRYDYHGEYAPSAHRVLRALKGARLLVKSLKPYLQPNDSVLEVGSGIGCTVKMFELAGFQSVGIEPGRGFYTYARDRVQAEVLPITLAQVPPVERHDLVLLVHVIEHFNFPRRAICHLRKILRPGGRLYVECPNIASPHAAPGKMFHYAHIYNFTPDTLRMLVESCGFQVAHEFTKPRDRTIRFLLSVAEARPIAVIPGSRERALNGIFRYNLLTYHGRWSYLRERVARDIHFVSDHWFPRLRVHRFLSAAQRELRQANPPQKPVRTAA